MKKILVAAALASVAYGGWRWHASEHSTASINEAKLLRDRLWVDHMPRGERDVVNILVVLSQHPVGTFQAAAAWKGTYENFRYEQSGDELRVVFPHTGDRERLHVRARRCKEQGMDYCLEVEGASRGVKRYYSREGWEIDTADDARGKLDALSRSAAVDQ